MEEDTKIRLCSFNSTFIGFLLSKESGTLLHWKVGSEAAPASLMGLIWSQGSAQLKEGCVTLVWISAVLPASQLPQLDPMQKFHIVLGTCESLSRAGRSHVFGPGLVRLTGSLIRLDLQVLKELSSKMSLTDIICCKSAGGFGTAPLMTAWLSRGAGAAAAAVPSFPLKLLNQPSVSHTRVLSNEAALLNIICHHHYCRSWTGGCSLNTTGFNCPTWQTDRCTSSSMWQRQRHFLLLNRV